MRIKTYFIIWSILIVCICIVICMISVQHHIFYLFLCEAITSLILLFLFIFYKQVIKPFDILSNGMDLLKEQDFSSQLNKVQQADADRLVEIFNTMITQLKNKRLRLHEQHYFLDQLINSSPLGILILSFDRAITSTNPTFLKQSGFSAEELLHHTLESFDTPLFQQLAKLKRDSSDTVVIDNSHIYKCIHSTFLDKGFRHSFYLVENLTEEMLAAERKGYEKIIRTMAHEVNNAIAGITSTLDTIQETVKENKQETITIQMLQNCIARSFSLSDFITRFVDVVKIPEPHLQPYSLEMLIDKCMQTMYTFCKKKEITLQKQNEYKHEAVVKIDPIMFEQVMINIIKNSAESIEKKAQSS